MSGRLTWSVVFAASLIGLNALAASGGRSSKVDALFKFDTLNSSLAYIEHQLGPAKYVQGDDRTYIVDGCKVDIHYSKSAVRNMGVDGTSTKCQFQLTNFSPNAKVTMATLTFGQLEHAFDSTDTVSVSCLGSCGNSADAGISLFHDGPHSENFIQVVAETSYPYRGKNTDKQIFALQDVLIKHESMDYNTMGYITCDHKYDALEKKLFKDVPVKSIYVGWDLEPRIPKCPVPMPPRR